MPRQFVMCWRGMVETDYARVGLREDADLDIGAAGEDDAGAVLRALEAQAELL